MLVFYESKVKGHIHHKSILDGNPPNKKVNHHIRHHVHDQVPIKIVFLKQFRYKRIEGHLNTVHDSQVP